MRQVSVRGILAMSESKKLIGASDNTAVGSDPKLKSVEPTNGVFRDFGTPTQLDHWFDSQLMQMYSEVVSEPLPKEFLELLDKLREKKSKSQ
jgi:hypothetical protein